MQAVSDKDPSSYEASLRDLRSKVEKLWSDNHFQEKFSNHVSNCRKNLEARIERQGLETSNCVFVCSGKSAQVSKTLLNSIALGSENKQLISLIADSIVLSPDENEEMYAGSMPTRLTGDKTLFFFDEHAQDYLKASSYLVTAENSKRKAYFFVFSGNPFPRDIASAAWASKILLATKDEQILTFLMSLGRTVSESNRKDLKVKSEMVEQDFKFSQSLLSPMLYTSTRS